MFTARHNWAAPDLARVAFSTVTTYTVRADGSLRIGCKVEAAAWLPALPRIGLRMQLPPALGQLGFAGRGPLECYPDRKVGPSLSHILGYSPVTSTQRQRDLQWDRGSVPV